MRKSYCLQTIKVNDGAIFNKLLVMPINSHFVTCSWGIDVNGDVNKVCLWNLEKVRHVKTLFTKNSVTIEDMFFRF